MKPIAPGTPPRVARPVGLLVTAGLVVTALVAPALSGGPSEISWNDVLAGVTVGALLAYLAMRALRTLRGGGHGAAGKAEV